MRIPLIVSWDARLNKRGPTVSLQAGIWKLLGNHKSAYLCSREPDLKCPIYSTDPLTFEGPGLYWVEFDASCKDAGISIYAEK